MSHTKPLPLPELWALIRAYGAARVDCDRSNGSVSQNYLRLAESNLGDALEAYDLGARSTAAQPVERWIPVTERLPSYDEELDVLCFSESHTFGGNEHFCTLKAIEFYEFDPDGDGDPGTPTSKCITHWMPRPWPPNTAAASGDSTPPSEPADGEQFWLWQNGDHFLAFRNLYPCYSPGGDPMTLGEPFGRAIFKHSHNREGKPNEQQRTDRQSPRSGADPDLQRRHAAGAGKACSAGAGASIGYGQHPIAPQGGWGAGDDSAGPQPVPDIAGATGVLAAGGNVAQGVAAQGDPSGALRPEPEAVGQGRWIAVTERQPKGREVILVAVGWVRYDEHEDGTPCETTGYDVTEGQYVPKHGEGEGYFESFQGSHGDSYGVTHWMPLPEPPQAASGSRGD